MGKTTTTDESCSILNLFENIIFMVDFPCEKSSDNGNVGILRVQVFVRLLRNISYMVAPYFHDSKIISIIVIGSFAVSLVENALACESQI